MMHSMRYSWAMASRHLITCSSTVGRTSCIHQGLANTHLLSTFHSDRILLCLAISIDLCLLSHWSYISPTSLLTHLVFQFVLFVALNTYISFLCLSSSLIQFTKHIVATYYTFTHGTSPTHTVCNNKYNTPSVQLSIPTNYSERSYVAPAYFLVELRVD